MDDPTPEALVREMFATFGPTLDDMVATAKRLFHEDMFWASAGFDPPRVTSRAELISDLEKAKSSKGIAGFSYEITSLAVDGNKVLTERFDHAYDADGNVVHSFRLMGIIGVRAARIAWVRDYFYDTREFAENYLPEQFSSTKPKILDDLVRSGN